MKLSQLQNVTRTADALADLYACREQPVNYPNEEFQVSCYLNQSPSRHIYTIPGATLLKLIDADIALAKERLQQLGVEVDT